MKKFVSMVVTILMLLVLVVGCSSSQSTGGKSNSSGSGGQSGGDTSGSPLKGKVITILTGGTSGVYFPLGTTLAKVYSEKLGAQASAQTTGASAENSAKINQGKAEIAFAMADTVSDAYNGKGKFAKTGAMKNLRAVAALYTNYMQIVTTKGSGINSLADLKGKRIAVGAPGSGTEIMTKRVLNAAGITYNDIQQDFLSFKEGVEGIKNGVIDAAFLVSGLPNAGIMELNTTKDIKLIPVGSDIVAKLKKDYPAFVSEKIPGGTYKGVDGDVDTAAVKNLLITNKNVPENEVYAMTKAFFENLQALRDTHNAANGIKLDKATDGLPIPLASGAEKYYKEKGVSK